jgi:mRNA-degrading endonuclease toxin of MazEF toxin-antitoxin module
MCDQVRAITTDRLGKHLGKLDQLLLSALDERLRVALDLS